MAYTRTEQSTISQQQQQLHEEEEQARLQELGLAPISNNNADDGASNDVTTSSSPVVWVIPADKDQPVTAYAWNNNNSNSSSFPNAFFAQLDASDYYALRAGETVNTTLIKNQILPAYRKGCIAKGGMCPHVSLMTLERNAAVGNVVEQNVNTATTSWRLFYDDSAQLKVRARNERAEQFRAMGASSWDKGSDGDSEELEDIYGTVFCLSTSNGNGEATMPTLLTHFLQ